MDEKLLDEVFTELKKLKTESVYHVDMYNGAKIMNDSVSFFHGDYGVINIKSIYGNAAFLKLQTLLTSDTFIFTNYTEKEIKDIIVKLISIDELDKELLQIEIKAFKNVKKEKFIVFLPVYGIEIEEEIQFGNFVFHNTNSLENKLKEIKTEKDIAIVIDKFGGNNFIEGTVKTRSKERAPELIQGKVTTLMNIIRFFIGSRKNTANINILRGSVEISKSLVIGIENETLTLNNKLIGPSRPVTLEDAHFSDNPVLEMFISNSFSEKKKSEIEKRLALGVQWVGESLNEQNEAMRFLKIFFAFEAILQVKAENQTEKMAELICFLLEDEKEKRLNLKNDFKELYNVRSRLSHGEIESVREYDIYYSYDLIYGLIDKIVDNLESFKTLDDINRYVDEIKYS